MIVKVSVTLMKNFFSRASWFISRHMAKLGHNKVCYACNTRIGRFLPYKGGWKNVSRLMIALDVVGSDVENFSCPRCFSHDRERHLLMYFDALSVWEKVGGGDVLHFAPEQILSSRILKLNPSRYVKADLFPVSSDITRENITRLSFSEKSFDIVIANHILEHVYDDNVAMKEIFRVLKPGGLAILQTPYSNKLQKTFSDPGIDDDESRLQAYGQADHVRLYGCDFFEKLEHAGLKSKVCTHKQVLSRFEPSIYGVNPAEPFICFQKIN